MKHDVVTPEYLTAAYVCVSVLVFMLICLLAYVTCSRKFKLNWYERTQLETTKNLDDFRSPVTGGDFTLQETREENDGSHPTASSGNSRFLRSQSSSARLDSPSTSKEFWVPISIQRQASFCQSDGTNDCISGEDSAPDTPNTPLGIKVSPFALSHMSQPERGVSPLVKNVQPSTQAILRPKVISMYGKLDHTKIDASLYLDEKDNETEFQEEGPGGSVTFSATYNPQYSLLCVHVIKAANLVPRDLSGTADPYVKVRLLPDVETCRDTTTQWKTLNPDYDEELVFDLPEPELKDRDIELLLFDFDPSSRHQCLGQAVAPLVQLNLQDNVPVWKAIHFCDQKDDKPELGDLMFSVGYLQSAERLTVVVLKSRNLKELEDGKQPDPYVKVIISLNGRRLKKKKKTNVQRGTTNPVFNEALSFNSINKELLKTLTIEFSVMSDNILGQNEILGNAMVGPNSKGEEAVHRQNFLSGRSAVAMWHALTFLPTTGGLAD